MEMNRSVNIRQTTSPSLATVSSPASSALGNSPLYGQYEVSKIISLEYLIILFLNDMACLTAGY